MNKWTTNTEQLNRELYAPAANQDRKQRYSYRAQQHILKWWPVYAILILFLLAAAAH